MSSARRAMVCMAAFAALWAVVEALGARLHAALSPYQVVWSRYAVHLVLVAIVWGRGPQRLWHTHRPLFHLGRSLLMLLMPACWILTLGIGGNSDAMLSVFWIAPLLIVAFGRMALAEQPAAWLWIATAVACAGAALVHGPALQIRVLPLALGMALSFSGYVAMTGKLRDQTVGTNLFYTALAPLVLLTPFLPFIWTMPDLHDVLILCAIGALGLLGLYAIDRAVAAAGISASAAFSALQVMFTFAFAWRPDQGSPGRRVALGVTVILVGCACVWLRAQRLLAEPLA